MLIEAAIGDAYGAGFEFAEREIITTYNTLEMYRPHGLYPEIMGRYTDDTQMALALAEIMVQGLNWTEEVLADKFVSVFKRDPRSNGTELRQRINPASQRNGAAMRAYVLGVYKDRNEVLEKAEAQAVITHNTSEAVESAKAVALAAHYLLYNSGEVNQIGEYLTAELGGQWNQNWVGEVGMQAHEAVWAALTLLKEENNLAQILRRAVAFGGDTDTVVSIALGCASCSPKFANNLPVSLINGLENGPYGRNFLIDLNKKLLAC
jgi:ADP-ribosyl-[dinitrogen reductase] hydrolase